MNGTEFSLPLANAKNRQLQKQVREKRDRIAQLVLELDQNENLLKTTEREVSTLEQTSIETNNVAHNFRNQTRKESELLKLATSEATTLDAEAKRLQQLLDQVLEHQETQRKHIAEQEENLNKLSSLFDKESKIVEVMEKMVESQQDDHGTLEKYSHQDNMLIKELELKAARVKSEADAAERQFKVAQEDRENAAIQLNNMQEEFRSMMEDRDQSLQRWEMTLAQNKVCREQLDQSRQEYQSVKLLANADQNRLDDVNRCIKQMQNDIGSLERTLYARELVASQMKLKLDEIEKFNKDQEAEHIAAEKMAKRLSSDIVASKGETENLKKKLADISLKLRDEQSKSVELEKKLEDAKKTVGSAQNQRNSLMQLSKAADDRLERQREHLNNLANEHVRVENGIRLAKSALSSCETKIKLCHSSLRYLDNHINTTKQQMKEKDEMIYKKNMEILHVEMDLRRLRSSLGDLEERQKHRQQIEALRGELDASNSYLVALKYELSKTQSDLIGLQRSCDLQQQRKNVLETLSRQLQSDCLSRERECNDLRRELEEIRMGESLIHLEIKRKESMIQTRSTAVQQLENQKKSIELAIDTRREELAGHKELLQLENRSLKERAQQLSIEVNQKAAEIERIKLRHEMVANTLVAENGPEETSEAYFIIKMAQEKELLKESINDLENLVTKLESDNIALNNTLKLIASSNQQFRQHTIVGILTDDDKALKVKMENENKLLENTIALLKTEAHKEMRILENLEEEIRKLKEDTYRIKFSVEEREVVYKDALEEVERVKSKIKRAKDLNVQMQRIARKARKMKGKLDEEIDFELVQMREHNQSAQAMLANVVQGDSDAKISLAGYLDDISAGVTPGRKKDGDMLSQSNALSPKLRLDITDFPLSAFSNGLRESPRSLHEHEDHLE